MKQFNEVVTYIRNGKELPALVVSSREIQLPLPDSHPEGQQPESEERLTLAYIDPETGLQKLNHDGTISRAYGVPPMKDGAMNGWKDAVVLHEGDLLPEFIAAPFDAAMSDIRADARKTIDELQATNTSLNEQIAQLKAAAAQPVAKDKKADKQPEPEVAAKP